MTRIEIQIPQHEPEQENLAFEFIDRPDGLVEFIVRADDPEDSSVVTEACIAAFRKVGPGIDTGFWAQGAVVASLTKKYGQRGDEIEKLAEAVERSPSHLRHMALTYRTFTTICPREQNLTFKHHMIACAYSKPQVALAVAVERGMPCSTLQEWVSEQNRKDSKRKSKKAKEQVKTDFLTHLEHVESVIEEDFIANCPSKDFAKRVYSDWLQQIKFELRQLLRGANLDKIRAAIEDEGAQTVAQIKNLTSLPLCDVEAVVGMLVAQGEYEWIARGGKKDDQRGQPEMILHKVGDSDGSGFTAARPVNNYAN